MNTRFIRFTIPALATLLAATAALAQQPLKLPRPSQKASLMQTVGLTDVTITWSRPGVKGRKIAGDLVPYDKVWRTGANEATTINFSGDVTIEGQPLPAGLYSLHTIPGKDSWTVIFNKNANQWGSYSYDAKQDALRVTVKPRSAPATEWLTFDVPQLSTDSATIELRWDTFAVPFTVGTNTTRQALASIDAALAAAKADDWRTAYTAAQFAINNKITSVDAGQWLDKSISANANLFNLRLKAQQQAKAGNKAAALATAEKALAAATAEQKEEADLLRKEMEGWKK
jgi:hypothetical protein